MNSGNAGVILISMATLLVICVIFMIIEAFCPDYKVFTFVKPIMLIAIICCLPFLLDPLLIDLDGFSSVDWVAFIQEIIPENFGFPICKAP